MGLNKKYSIKEFKVGKIGWSKRILVLAVMSIPSQGALLQAKSVSSKMASFDIIKGFKIAIESILDANECVNPITLFSYPIMLGGYFHYQDQLIEEGHSGTIPDCLHQLIRDEYDLNPSNLNVRMEVTDTPDSETAITLENTIFFPYEIDFLATPDDLHWLLHELEHVSQWKKKGVASFLAEYICAVGVNVDSFDLNKMHDGIQLEKAAEAKADRLLSQAWERCN